jgi:DNA-binding transcriptional ArsR family regulator
MPVIKTEGFRRNDVELAALAKALSHPARIAILRDLARRNECICGEIVNLIPLAQATVSQHLKELRRVGLITGQIEGPRSCYCLNPRGIKVLSATISSFLEELEKHCEPQNCP